MKNLSTIFLYLPFVAVALGCTAEAEPTDDSIKLETEIPKVKVGERSPDLDPRTDDDVDVDTPLSGDQ